MANDIGTAPVPPGSTIGILGSGQLGRMLVVAAAELGFKTHVYSPDETSPASQVASSTTVASYDDEQALRTFAEQVEVVTCEFENVPAEAANLLSSISTVRPGAKGLQVAQDRLDEKKFLQDIGERTAPYLAVNDLPSLQAAVQEIGTPSILKTRRFGYDGKGQTKLSEDADLQEAINGLKGAPAILEGFINFEREISVIVARGVDGQSACFDPVENIHENHILAKTTVPARLSAIAAERAMATATHIVDKLDYIGVMGVELFVEDGGRILVNEIAPRVHNSGHWTQDACATSQFEQHIRAVCGWPLGSPDRHSDAIMHNLIGKDVERWQELAANPHTHIHLYGKTQVRDGRKMGHATELLPLGRLK